MGVSYFYNIKSGFRSPSPPQQHHWIHGSHRLRCSNAVRNLSTVQTPLLKQPTLQFLRLMVLLLQPLQQHLKTCLFPKDAGTRERLLCLNSGVSGSFPEVMKYLSKTYQASSPHFAVSETAPYFILKTKQPAIIFTFYRYARKSAGKSPSFYLGLRQGSCTCEHIWPTWGLLKMQI